MNEYILVTLENNTTALINMRNVISIKHVESSDYTGTEVYCLDENSLYIKETPEEVYAKVFPKKIF